ncbi:hypothetical protein Y1Q_0014198 [Alligator mississippiensis]|uniref:Uncharacterized protein n=1 Tax=Alligator mississippiensis TaxID=8496 RepID=A0A151MU07_ALLMI|nr:hypothetical protein Y1Q_0014198 [Alligator mississippiensis]
MAHSEERNQWVAGATSGLWTGNTDPGDIHSAPNSKGSSNISVVFFRLNLKVFCTLWLSDHFESSSK